jgi:triacylglycerol esterase/lipase EstA (alpha/beta hydrolase family)
MCGNLPGYALSVVATSFGGLRMATIITVHGTGATGPEEGEAWWQKGSAFENHIRELVEGEDGTLDFQPVLWDGANSEASRRAAAAKLYQAARQLESKDQKYCLIGHSHGGSVLVNMLLLAASQRNRLPHLTRWITVGTPFIQSVRSFWLFSRLGPLGKSSLVLVVAYMFLLLGLTWNNYSSST